MAESIEKATAADIVFIKRIELQCSLSSWSEADYLKELNRRDSLFFAAKGNSNVQGFILARLIMLKELGSEFNEIEIYNIAVRKDARHKQIGSKLLERLFQIAENTSVDKLYLEVRKSNSGAIRFYSKNGFEIIGSRKNFYTNPLEDAILMSRSMNFPQNP